MRQRSFAKLWVGGLGAVAAIGIGCILAYRATGHHEQHAAAQAGTTSPADRAVPVSQKPAAPASKPAGPKTSDLSYLDLVRAKYPSLPTTQPLAVPLELSQAARIILNDPIYFSPARGDLWISRADAPPLATVLKAAIDPDGDAQTHLVRERVLFVQWIATDSGQWLPYLICANAAGGCKVCSLDGTAEMPSRREFDWGRAFAWDDKVVVPSRQGVSVFQLRPTVAESFCELLPSSATVPTSGPARPPAPQALPDGKGLLAWVPWEHGQAGGLKAARYVDGKWNDLGPDQGWPAKIVQLVPLRDGSVFQFVAKGDGLATVETSALDQDPVDPAAIEKLVGGLGDVDPEVRRKAYTDLSNYGPGAWPVLTKLIDDQPPQTQLLLRQLLKDQRRPTLSGMTLLGDRTLQLVDRLSDGGAVFYAPQGVSIPEPDGDPSVTAPAWLGVRPGHYIECLPDALVADLKPETGGLDVVGDQWIVASDVRGPRLFFGNGFTTLLRKDERSFSRVVGVDSRGRWLFRKPAEVTPSATSRPADSTLILDPHLPDPTPRLPVWQLAIAESVGWDKDNWPVVKNGAAYALTESDWRPLSAEEKFFSRPEDVPPTAGPATTDPTTAPAMEPADGLPLLVAPDGTRYFDGQTTLRVIRPDRRSISWPLPPLANGTGNPRLVRTRDGKLFLFNQPGRVLRIAPTSAGPEPFKIEATFAHNIPSGTPTRVWVDPAGRIVMDVDGRLALLFAEGYIPRAISEKMLDAESQDADAP